MALYIYTAYYTLTTKKLKKLRISKFTGRKIKCATFPNPSCHPSDNVLAHSEETPGVFKKILKKVRKNSESFPRDS